MDAMKKFNLSILGVVLLLWNCQDSDFKMYDAANYLQFVQPFEDTTIISFTFYPGEDELMWPIEVEMSGMLSEHELFYDVVIDEEYTTAVEGEHYELLDDFSMAPMATKDTCWIRLFRTPEMETTEYQIVLRVVDSDAFLRGQLDYSVVVLRVNDKLARPDWWDNNVVWYYLGEYSDKKFSLFIDVTGKADLTGASDSELRAYALQFKYWLQAQKETGNTIREEDDEEMTVAVLG